MNFQIVYISPELSKEYGATVNNVAGVLFVLSDKGARPVQATEAFIAERVCLSERMVRKAKMLLRENGYINVTVKQEGFKRCAVIECTEKLVHAFDFPMRNIEPSASGMEYLNDKAQCSVSDRHEMQSDRHSVPSQQEQCAVSDQAQCADINKYKEYIKQQENNEVHTAQCTAHDRHTMPNDYSIPEELRELFEIPLPLEDCGATEEPANDNNPTVEPEIIPEKKKRKSSAADCPKSVEETEELIERYKTEHLSEPKIEHLDVHAYAVQIFDWYTAKGDQVWRDKNGKQIKIPYRAVCNWINSDAKQGKLKTAFTAKDFEKAMHRTTIEATATVVNEWNNWENDKITFEG